ncbi:MAG TPA: class I SAM-dependent methyltransferase [Candidatus Paceibacterota bacterium]|nr:class I SAM-dependent methyltransferase [Candidatus Paceibacterota bacterium]
MKQMPHKLKQRGRGKHAQVWDKEYQTAEHLKLSLEPGEDFLKGVRFIKRRTGREFLNPTSLALDLGTGNGRHLIYLAENYAMRGIGYDISEEAIRQAREASAELPITYEARSIAGDFNAIRNGSVALALDLMTSHFLKKVEREHLREEILRVLKPHSISSGQAGGWLIFKSFLGEEDLHVKRLLRDYPADEAGAYIHPEFGVYEYVWEEDSLREFFEPYFEIHKIEKSHRHRDKQGRAAKRRTITAYLQKI